VQGGKRKIYANTTVRGCQWFGTSLAILSSVALRNKLMDGGTGAPLFIRINIEATTIWTGENMATGAAVFSPVCAFETGFSCSASETLCAAKRQPEKATPGVWEVNLTRISLTNNPELYAYAGSNLRRCIVDADFKQQNSLLIRAFD
jgi:hypothetical protein